jgi:hypothetical protein
MTISVDIYKGPHKLGSGTATNASASITSVSANASRVIGTNRNVTLVATTGNNVGASWRARVTNDGGSTLTLQHMCPYS